MKSKVLALLLSVIASAVGCGDARREPPSRDPTPIPSPSPTPVPAPPAEPAPAPTPQPANLNGMWTGSMDFIGQPSCPTRENVRVDLFHDQTSGVIRGFISTRCWDLVVEGTAKDQPRPDTPGEVSLVLWSNEQKITTLFGGATQKRIDADTDARHAIYTGAPLALHLSR